MLSFFLGWLMWWFSLARLCLISSVLNVLWLVLVICSMVFSFLLNSVCRVVLV